jgi:hypothetical protein
MPFLDTWVEAQTTCWLLAGKLGILGQRVLICASRVADSFARGPSADLVMQWDQSHELNRFFTC